MHATEISKTSESTKEEKDDGPSVLGRFMWTIVGSSCIPCLLKNDGTKYVSVRIAESKVLSHFLLRLNAEVFNCVSVKSFGITEAEMKLLNEINSKHCEFTFGRDAFSMDSDFIVRLDDLIEFYQFMDTCYNKLVNQTPVGSKNKCGFVRINDDSVVPYAVKNDQKYVPLFYFEGETESLKTKAINLENWDLAYLKFCCKVQGIKNELFASEQCMVTSLEDVKSYFPEGTKFDDYWPSKVVEMQTPTRNDINGNHSWVQTPHIDSSAVPQSTVSSASHNIVKSHSSILTKQLHNSNQRSNTTAMISNMPSSIYPQGNTWPSSVMGNSVNSAQPGTYQMTPASAVTTPRLAPKQSPINVHPINSNSVVTSRSYSNSAVRSQNQFFPTTATNVPNIPPSVQQPPSLVKVPTGPIFTSQMPTASYSPLYSNASQSMYSVAPQPHILNTSVAGPISNKPRSISNQVTSNVTRYPPALTPINGTNNIIQTSNSTPVISNITSNMNNVMVNNNRFQRSCCNQNDGEVIDLLSPPHSPLHSNSIMNKRPAAITNSYGYNKISNNTNSGKIITIPEVSMAQPGSTLPAFEVQQRIVKDRTVDAINLDPHSYTRPAITLFDVHNHYFPGMETNELKNSLLNGVKCDLYVANTLQQQKLREYKPKAHPDDLLLISIDDFNKKYAPLQYVVKNNMTNRVGRMQKGRRSARAGPWPVTKTGHLILELLQSASKIRLSRS